MNRLPQGCEEIYELSSINAGCFTLNARGDLALLAGYGDLQIMNLNRPRDAFLRGEARNKWPVQCAKWGELATNENSFLVAKHNVCDVWELDSNGSSVSYKFSCKGHAQQITDLDWCPLDGAHFATSSLDNYTLIWDVRDPRRPSISLRSAAVVSQVRWSLHNNNIIATAHDTTLNLIDIRKQLVVHTVYAHESKISSLEWCSFDSCPSGGMRTDFENASGANANGGQYVLTSGRDGFVKVWHMDSGSNTLQCVASGDASRPVWRARFAPFGFALLAALDDGDEDASGPEEREEERSAMRFWNAEDIFANQTGRALFTHPERVIDFHFRHVAAMFNTDARERRSSVASWKLVTWCADRCLRIWKVTKSGVNALLHAAPAVSYIGERREAERGGDQPRRNTIASSPATSLSSPSAATRSATISGDAQFPPPAPRSRRVLLSGDNPVVSGDDHVPSPPFCRAVFSGDRLVCLFALERSPIGEQGQSQPPQTHMFARTLAQFEQQVANAAPSRPHHAMARQSVLPLSYVAVCDVRCLATGSSPQLPAVPTDFRMPLLLVMLFRPRERLAVANDALNACRRELLGKCSRLRDCAVNNIKQSELATRSDLEAVWSACASLVMECDSECERRVAASSVGRHVLFRVVERCLQLRDLQTLATVACYFTALDTLSRYEALIATVLEEINDVCGDRNLTAVCAELDLALLEHFWHFEDVHGAARARTPSHSLAGDSQSTALADSCTPINEATISQYVIVSNEHKPLNTNTNGKAQPTLKLERQCSVESAFAATSAAAYSRKPQTQNASTIASTRKSPSPSVCSNDVGSASYTARSSLADTQTLTAERATDYDDVRTRSASNQSTASSSQLTSKLLNRLDAASYVQPRFATLLDYFKLAYVRKLRSNGAHELAEDVLSCLFYPLKFYTSGTSFSAASRHSS